MWEPKFEKRGLVRAVFVVDIDQCGHIDATSRERAEAYGNIWAVGKWIRDDDPKLQEKLEKDFAVLNDAYAKIGGNRYCGGIYCYEYKEYRK